MNDAALYALARDIEARARRKPKQHLSRESRAEAHYQYAGRGLKTCPRCGARI